MNEQWVCGWKANGTIYDGDRCHPSRVAETVAGYRATLRYYGGVIKVYSAREDCTINDVLNGEVTPEPLQEYRVVRH